MMLSLPDGESVRNGSGALWSAKVHRLAWGYPQRKPATAASDGSAAAAAASRS
jgi:hypothetical protein